MPRSSLFALPLQTYIEACKASALERTSHTTPPTVVVSPYRFNPLGAHIDHQGGSVLARSLNQYTVLCYWPSESRSSTIQVQMTDQPWQRCEFKPGELEDIFGWDAMARASVTALDHYSAELARKSNTSCTVDGSPESPEADADNTVTVLSAESISIDQCLQCGIDAVVFGTLVSGGLSSSASVILAYLTALADCNDLLLSAAELVELSRRVENDYRGLNNGIQDQMSIAFARQNHLAVLDVESVNAELLADPAGIDEVCFLMCYSGVSRDLGGSPFNTRVAECQAAAELLYPGAKHLGQVPQANRGENAVNNLPDVQARRSRHVFSEMQRVDQGAQAWAAGDWSAFGDLMNASCRSSINDYESGSEWLIALHEIARELPGVYGCRFSGGGYGGCLFMLVRVDAANSVADSLMEQYLAKYPDKKGVAKVMVAESESTVRIVQP